MPYIKPERRLLFKNQAEYLADTAKSWGEVNYSITILIDRYFHKTSMKYEDYQAVKGLISCLDVEFDRKRLIPYEMEKEKANGDVFLPLVVEAKQPEDATKEETK